MNENVVLCVIVICLLVSVCGSGVVMFGFVNVMVGGNLVSVVCVSILVVCLSCVLRLLMLVG